MTPIPRPRRSAGIASATMAIATGTSAPPPTAWKPRASAIVVKSRDNATQAEPAMNTARDAAKTRPCPRRSETRPITGMAMT